MKPTALAILVAAILIGGVVLFMGKSSGSTAVAAPANNVTVSDGKQVVAIGVKGGYLPQQSSAKADMPTVLRMKTNGTFDCSSGVTIPSLGIRKILPQTGETDITVPAQKAGTTLEGVCIMGMYHFAVNFE
jgi:plastocyanin domain-containing protein